MRITVAMATYNGVRHLDEQLASIEAQTRPPHELVVGDDGSTDGTVALLQRFSERAPFAVRILQHAENLGPDQNFSAVIAAATGDVVLCCDQDDRWHPDKIARLAAVLEAEPQVGLVMSDAALVDEQMRPTGTTLWGRFEFGRSLQDRVLQGDGFAVFARRMPVYGCTIAVRTALAAHFLPVPRGATFDSWIGQVVAVVAEVRLIEEPLIDYRQHAAQFTGFAEGSRWARLRGMVTRSDAAAVRSELVRLEAMERRLALLPHSGARDRAQVVTSDRLRLARRRLAARASVRRRAPLIAVGLARGEYRRGAQGLRSALIDLIAPRDR